MQRLTDNGERVVGYGMAACIPRFMTGKQRALRAGPEPALCRTTSLPVTNLLALCKPPQQSQ